MDDSDNDVRDRYIELLKAFHVEGFTDEFRISGKQVTINEYGDETLSGSENGESKLAQQSHSLVWQAFIPLVCAGFAFVAHRVLYRGDKNDGKIEKRERRRRKTLRVVSDEAKCKKDIVTRENRTDSSTKDELNMLPTKLSDAPDLVQEKINHTTIPIAMNNDLLCKSCLESPQLSLTSDAFETDFVKTAKSIRKIIENSGMGGSDEMMSSLSWQAAMTLKQTEAICQATAMAESRGYIFQAQQNHLSREINARQHEELLTSIREDKTWLRRLVDARDNAFAALRVACLRSFALILGFKPFIMTTRLLASCRVHSFTDLLAFTRDLLLSCPRSGSELSNEIGFSLQPSYWYRSYINSYFNGASCVANNAASMTYTLLFCSAAGLLSRTFGLPSLLTALVVWFLTFSDTFLSNEILMLLAIVLILTIAGASCTIFHFWASKQKFLTSKHIPSSQQVGESLLRFSRVVDAIQWCPYLLAIWLFTKISS